MKTSSIIAAAVVVAFIGYWFSIYNNIVAMQKEVEHTWAQIQVTYKNRADATPKLLAIVKTHVTNEDATINNVNKALEVVLQIPPVDLSTKAAQLQQYDQAQQSFSQALTQLVSLAEKYPDLNADSSFLSLQIVFAGYDNQATIERQHYQLVAQNYNSYISESPNKIVASILGYAPAPCFSEDNQTNTSSGAKAAT